MSTRNEVHINSALQLLQARKEALDRMNREPMRPHGKVLGRDLFTWFDFQLDDFINTILSFPYPVHWIAKKEDVLTVFKHSKEMIDRMVTVAIYDSPKFQLPIEIAEKVTNCISCENMEGALIMIRAVKSDQSVMIITGDTSDWQLNRNYIEDFIEAFKK
jgi:hypothetical protein